MSPKSAKFSFLKVSLQLLAAILVLFALLVSLSRGLLPQLDHVRAELVDYIQDKYQVDVQVGQLQAQWQAFGPALTVKHFVLPAQEQLPVTLKLEQVRIKFDFWQSLLTASPQIDDVIFDGAEVSLDLDRLSAATPNTPMDTDWLYQLLLEQLDRFSISQARLQLLSQDHQYRPIFIKDMEWLNAGAHHRGQGKLFLDEQASEVELLALSVDIAGDGAKPESLTGQIYLAAASLDIGKWASRQTDPFNANKSLQLAGVVNLQAWFNVANRTIDDALVAFQPSWLAWQLNGQTQKFEVQSGQVHWQPTAEGWQLNSDELTLMSNDHHWPAPMLRAQQTGDQFDAHINQLDLSMLLPLLPLVPSIEPAALDLWQSLSPQGQLSNSHLQWLAHQSTPHFSVDVEQISWQAEAGIPGIAPIDAKVQLSDNALHFTLPKQAYSIDFNGGFSAPLVFDGHALQGDFDFNNMALTLPKVQLSNADLSINAAARLMFSQATHLALLAELEINDVNQIYRYFPLQGMSQNLIDYLTGALKAGKTDDAVIVWQGALQSYPYTNYDGMFQASFTLEQAAFEFQDSWPAVTELNLSALFENAAMDLRVNKGQLMDVAADGTYVGIAALNRDIDLIVKADLATQAAAVNAVIQRSPLKDSVGSTLEVVNIDGEISGTLDLNIPLYDDAKASINGSVNFNNTPVYITEPGIALEAVTGQLQFANDAITGKNLQGLLYGQPLEFSFYTGQTNKNYAINMDLKGQWQWADLPEELHSPLRDYYRGEMQWTGGLMLIFDQTGYRIQASVHSDLLGTELDLPAPFNKSATQPAEFSAELIGDNKQSSLGIKLNKQLEFWGGFDSKTGYGLAHYDLLIGRLFKPGDQLNKKQGHLKIDLEHADFSQWLPIIQDLTAPTAASTSSAETSTDPFLPPLVSMEADFEQLNLMGQALTGLHFDAAPTEHAWRFYADSAEFNGRIDFYPDWRKQGLKVVASKLYLSPAAPKKETVEQATQNLLNHLPPLAVDVDEFKILGRSMGHFVLQASPVGDVYQIQTLSMSTQDIKLSGEGLWSFTGGVERTAFTLKLEASKFDHLSDQLGIDAGLKDAPTTVSGQVSWIGAPYAFSLATLNGDVDFKLGKGHLSEVSDKGARIFSLFSLDSLRRKLSLDFSDVFGEGLYFDSFMGTLKLDNGVVKTTDTEMNAVAGNMRVRGYTNLVTESLNYDIRFVPKLASSVPTVVLLSTGGWVLGLGAFALTKVLEPVIEVISEIRFRLTGTMSNPKLEELSRKSKEIEIPESALPKKAAVTKQSSHQEAALTPQSKSLQHDMPQEAVLLQNEVTPANKTINPPNIEPAQQTEALKVIKGESDVREPITVSKWLQRQREPRVHRIAA
ncbi:YhdP family protein [Shewanella sp.]|nr:YhdP family protein [Shewanella sp.]